MRPLALFDGQDEFGRPIKGGLDEFGFPAGDPVIAIEAGVVTASLSGRATTAIIRLQVSAQQCALAAGSSSPVIAIDWKAELQAPCSLDLAAGAATGLMVNHAMAETADLALQSHDPLPFQEWMAGPADAAGLGLSSSSPGTWMEYLIRGEMTLLRLGTLGATDIRVHLAGPAEECSLGLAAGDPITWIEHLPRTDASQLALSSPNAAARRGYLIPKEATSLGLEEKRNKVIVGHCGMHAYSVLICDVTGAPIAFVVPKAVEYSKVPNMPGKVKITLPSDHPAAAELHRFTEGYVYRRGVLWQGIVPEGRSLGGEDLVLDCLTFEALLKKWRLPRDWSHSFGELSGSMKSIVEKRFDTYTKTNSDDFTATERVNCTMLANVGSKASIRMGKYEGGVTTASSVIFTWIFPQPVELYITRFRMTLNTTSVDINLNNRVSYDGTTWPEWGGNCTWGARQWGQHEYEDFMLGYEFGAVKGIQVKISVPDIPERAYIYFEGIEMITWGPSGYTLTHTVADSDYLPGLYRFDNSTVMDALASMCSDSGYAMRVTPDKQVYVDRAGSDAPWVLTAGADERHGGVEILEAGTSGESEITNELLIRGYGQGTGALAVHRKDEASAALYGPRTAIAANPTITNTDRQRYIADGMLAELAWPRPDIKVRLPVSEKKGRSAAPWASDVKVGDAVALCWPGGVAYGAGAAGPGEWFYVTEEQRRWAEGAGEVCELRLARKPGAQDRAVAVTQIPVPVASDTTAVRITLGSTKR